MQCLRGDAMSMLTRWRACERYWQSDRAGTLGLTEFEFWFLVEGILRALWLEQPAPPFSGSTIPDGHATEP